MALSQCSTRITSPKRGLGHRATSPAATTPGAARQVSSHTTPSSSVSPEPSSQPVFGVTPMPTTTTSASTAEPSASRTRSTRVAAGEPGHADAQAHVDAVVAVQVGAGAADHLAEHPRQRDRQRLDHRDVEAPLAAGRRHLGADEAGADHHHPAGARVELGRGGRGSRRACAACGPRPARRARAACAASAPVAMTSPSKATSLAVGEGHAGAAARSSPVARVPSRQSRSRSSPAARQLDAVGRPTSPRAPASTAAAGRRARCGSSPITTTRPSKPSLPQRLGRPARRRGTRRRRRSTARARVPAGVAQSSMEMACFGQRRTASSTFGRLSSGGFSSRT